MSLLDIIRIPELGLELFQNLELNDIDTCRVVCREMRDFVDNVVHKSRRMEDNLKLGYKRQKWMWGRPLVQIPLDFTCDLDEPTSWHHIERSLFISDKLILVVNTPRINRRSVLTYDDEGHRVGWVNFEGRIKFTQRTKTSLLLIMDIRVPGLLWNVNELAGYHVVIERGSMVHVGSVNDKYYWVFQETMKSTIIIEERDPNCIYEISKSFAIDPYHEPDEKLLFNFSAKWIMIQYPVNGYCILEAFNIETGEREHMMPYPYGNSPGFKHAYIESDFQTPDFAILFQTHPKCIDLATFEPIAAFRHVKMVNYTRTWSNRVRTFYSLISNRFAVRIMEKESHRPLIWVIWIGDLLTKKHRKFSGLANPIRIRSVDIIDDVILVMDHLLECRTPMEKQADGELVSGQLTAYDLCETDEAKFWGNRVKLGLGRIGCESQEKLGNFGVLTSNNEVGNQRILLRLPFKRSHRK